MRQFSSEVNMKKLKSVIFLVIVAVFSALLCVSCLDASVPLAENGTSQDSTPTNYNTDGSFGKSYRDETYPSPSKLLLGNETDSLLNHSEVTNVVIFIYFNDETESDFQSSLNDTLISKFNGDKNSLLDYYRTLSYGTFSVRSVMPSYYDASTGSDKYYVYKAPNPRSYYLNVSAESGTARYDPESRLLNAAVSSADKFFDYTGLDLDVNDDGFVDSVSFIVSGDYKNPDDWGELMWPHAWDLNRISNISSDKKNSSTLNGIFVGSYTYTFAKNFRLGLVAHEFGHLIGLPDLYHYQYDTSYLPVGYWDIMHYECTTPQFMLTYMRQKYLNFIGKSQVKELTVGGSYSLTPTATADNDDVLAYKITISNKESIWIEYRHADPNSYDAELPGSGLIVYRVNNSVNGNTDAKYHNYLYPEEVYVFRPSCAPSSLLSTLEREKYNLTKSAIGMNNPDFYKIGNSSSTGLWQSDCIYTSSGANTGIVVTVEEQTNEKITFSIDLGEYDCNDISDSYITGTNLEGSSIKNTHHMYYGETPNISVFLKYKNRTSVIEITDFTIDYNPEPSAEGQIAYAVFHDGIEERKLPFTLYVYDRVLAEANVVRIPDKTVYGIGDKFDLSGLIIKVSYTSGNDIEIAYNDENKDLWTIAEGIDMFKRGTYDNVIIVYNGEVRFALNGIRINSSLISIKISERDTTHFKTRTLKPKYNVIATYEDGTTGLLSEEAYTVSEGTDDNEYKTVTVTSAENPSATCLTFYYDMGSALAIGAEISGNTSFNLTFGEEPDLTQNTLTLRFANGLYAENIPLENYFSMFMDKLNMNTTGKQAVSISIDSAVVSINVAVSAKNNSILTIGSQDKVSESIIIDNDNNCIILKENFTLSQLSSYLASYLNLAYYDRSGDYEIFVGSHANRMVGYDVKLQLLTDSGRCAVEYSVYRLGDADGNGTIENADVFEWIDTLISVNTSGIYRREFDANFDTKYTLTDFVILYDTEGKYL